MVLEFIKSFAFLLNCFLIIMFWVYPETTKYKKFWQIDTIFDCLTGIVCFVFIISIVGNYFDLVSISFVQYMSTAIDVAAWIWLGSVIFNALKKRV